MKTFLRRAQLASCKLDVGTAGADAGPQLGRAKPEQAIQGSAPAQGIGSKLRFGRLVPVSLQQQAAEIIVGLAQVLVQGQCPAVGLLSFSPLARIMPSQAQIIPCLCIRDEQGSGRRQSLHRLSIFPPLDQPLPLQHRPWTRRLAARQQCQAEHQQTQVKPAKQPTLVPKTICDGLHQGSW